MKYLNVAEYIAHQPLEAQIILEGLRHYILNAAPYMEEKLSYGVPFFYSKGALCYLAMEKGKPYVGFMRGLELSDEVGLLETKGRKQVKSITFESVEAWEYKKAHLPTILQEALLVNELRQKRKKTL